MGYKLKGSKSFSHEIKGIVTEQIDNALDCLKQSGRNKDEGIHEARVCVKKIRALLRLIKDSLGPASFEAEDKAYRDTARSLSKIRDSAARLELACTSVEEPDRVTCPRMPTSSSLGPSGSVLGDDEIG